MNKALFYKSEVITSLGTSLAETVSNIKRDKVNFKRTDHLIDDSASFICGLADWNNSIFQNSPHTYKNEIAISILIDKVLRNSRVQNFDQVICLITPSLQDLDFYLQTNNDISKFTKELEYPSFIIQELARHNCLIRKDQIQIVDNTCTSGNTIIGYAYQGLKLGVWKSVLLLAVDLTDAFNLHVLKNLGALAVSDLDPEKISRPFDKLRSGFIKSDGASCAILSSDPLLEDQSLGEVLAFSQTADAHKLTDGRDDCLSIIKAMELAVERSSLSKNEVNFIKAHGTSTGLNDLHEAKAISKVFNQQSPGPIVFSLKGHLGHVTDSSGLVENSIVCASIESGKMFPTRNLENTEFDLNFLREPQKLIKNKEYVFLSNALGFGGNNSCLIFKSKAKE